MPSKTKETETYSLKLEVCDHPSNKSKIVWRVLDVTNPESPWSLSGQANKTYAKRAKAGKFNTNNVLEIQKNLGTAIPIGALVFLCRGEL